MSLNIIEFKLIFEVKISGPVSQSDSFLVKWYDKEHKCIALGELKFN